jgi:hypothetical protein
VAVLCLALAFSSSPAGAASATPYVDGISDQSLPAWDGDFAESYFARLFSAVWVSAGHIRLARYVAQWDAISESTSGANPHGDYHEKLEAWLTDVGELGLEPEIALTSYNGRYPETVEEYQRALGLILDRARTLGHPFRYVEAWNEPNNQGAESARKAAQMTNTADALCARGYGCTVVAGNLEDAPDAARYEHEYEKALDFAPAIWGVHPYYSLELESETPLASLIAELPHGGAGERIWFTEIAARVCTDYGGRLVDDGELAQAAQSRWLIDVLMRNRRPEHVFYFAFLPGERRAPSCSSEREDDALYEPRAAPDAPDVPRPAASYIWDGEPYALAPGCSEPLSVPPAAGGAPVASAWAAAGEASGWSLSILTNGCTTLAGDATATFIP